MFIAAFVLIVLLSVIDGSLSSALFLVIIYIMGMLLTYSLPSAYRQKGGGLFDKVYITYITIAYIVSQSFTVYDHYIVSDSSRYIESYINRISFFYNSEDFYNCYLNFSDTNLLYNSFLNIIAMFANNYLGGMTIYGMTLLQTVWGILSTVVLFRIFARHIEVEKAYRYTLVFALCTLFLFYSTVIIRDIVICFLYLCAFDVVDQKFSLTGVVKLLVIMFLVWGVRLYSGLFVAAFIAYYLYVRFRNSHFKSIATILFAAVLIVAAEALMASSIMEQTTAELQGYEELSAERSAGGMVSKLQSLPSGISHLAIVLFTMIRPLPPFGIYAKAETFSNVVMSSVCLIAGFFWFVVFYSLCYQLFFKKYIFKIPFESVVLLVICLVFLLANASHPDVRRMLPVFPVLFLQFAKLCDYEGMKLFGSKVSKSLITLYIVMAFGMLFIM